MRRYVLFILRPQSLSYVGGKAEIKQLRVSEPDVLIRHLNLESPISANRIL